MKSLGLFALAAGGVFAALALSGEKKAPEVSTKPVLTNAYWQNRTWIDRGKYTVEYERAAQRHSALRPWILHAIALVESNENDARYVGADGHLPGKAGEMGMMQIIPNTLEYIQANTPGGYIYDVYTPAGATQLAASLLTLNLNLLDNDLTKAIIAYNAGTASDRIHNEGDWYLIRVQSALNRITKVTV